MSPPQAPMVALPLVKVQYILVIVERRDEHLLIVQ